MPIPDLTMDCQTGNCRFLIRTTNEKQRYIVQPESCTAVLFWGNTLPVRISCPYLIVISIRFSYTPPGASCIKSPLVSSSDT